MGFAANIFEKPIPTLRPDVPKAPIEKSSLREFDEQEARRLFGTVDSWESFEKILEYLTYVPMSNGEKVSADDWIRRINRVRNGESSKLVTSVADMRATVDHLMKTIGGG